MIGWLMASCSVSQIPVITSFVIIGISNFYLGVIYFICIFLDWPLFFLFLGFIKVRKANNLFCSAAIFAFHVKSFCPFYSKCLAQTGQEGWMWRWIQGQQWNHSSVPLPCPEPWGFSAWTYKFILTARLSNFNGETSLDSSVVLSVN